MYDEEWSHYDPVAAGDYVEAQRRSALILSLDEFFGTLIEAAGPEGKERVRKAISRSQSGGRSWVARWFRG